jgi:hypothetical protein
MLKQIYKIDVNGYIEESYVAEFDENDNPVEEWGQNIVTAQPPDGLYRAKWTGTEWQEDMPQQEIDAILNAPQPKSQLEILQETVDQLVLDALLGGA